MISLSTSLVPLCLSLASQLHLASTFSVHSRSCSSVPFHPANERRVASTLGVTNGARDGPASATFYDIDEECEGKMCHLADHSDAKIFAAERLTSYEQRFWSVLDVVIRLVPIVNPIAAYFSYEELAKSVDLVTELLSDNRWVAVDGGAYQARIIAPAINGVVVPAISILFATLISNTVSTLRQRALDIRTTINKEAGDLRFLQSMIDAFPPGLDQDKCRSYLVQYTSRLIAESQPGVKINSLEPTGMDSEMNGMLTELNEMTKSYRDLPSHLFSESYGAVTRLNTERSQRISALQSIFPSLHFAIVSALALSICVAFLMETNQELLIFLNSIQLRILWTMLIGTFSALGVVCYDLNDPFGGSYQISKSVDQLFTIRSALRASDSMADTCDLTGGHEDW